MEEDERVHDRKRQDKPTSYLIERGIDEKERERVKAVFTRSGISGAKDRG